MVMEAMEVSESCMSAFAWSWWRGVTLSKSEAAEMGGGRVELWVKKIKREPRRGGAED